MLKTLAIFATLATGLALPGCGSDPILAKADEERAADGDPSGAATPPGAHPPGQPAQPQPGDPGQPSPGDAINPPTGAPDQPQPGVPDQPQPGVPDVPDAGSTARSAPVEGPSVLLKGEVRYKDYQGGKVRLDLFDGDQRDLAKRPSVVGWTELSAPGPFEIRVSTDNDKIWLSAFNDANSNGKPDHEDPTGHYEDNPVRPKGEVIDDLVIQLEYNPRPEGE